MYWYLEVLKKYTVFGGRARRKEYWYYTLFNFLIVVGLTVMDMMFGLYNRTSGFGLLSGLYSLAVLLPGLAVSVRRLHDIGKSGWWIFIALVPCVGWIILLVFLATDSVPGDNEYGPNPKQYQY
jgi:uncharacterized membrane protein YhaH (DUF805 family)